MPFYSFTAFILFLVIPLVGLLRSIRRHLNQSNAELTSIAQILFPALLAYLFGQIFLTGEYEKYLYALIGIAIAVVHTERESDLEGRA